MNVRAVTLIFNDVVPQGRWELSGFQGADADVYKLDCADFRRHLAAIAEILPDPPTTGPELLACPSIDRPVLLTFDDGGVSAALYVADMLDEIGWKAHVLITAGRIGTPGSWIGPKSRNCGSAAILSGASPIRIRHEWLIVRTHNCMTNGGEARSRWPKLSASR